MSQVPIWLGGLFGGRPFQTDGRSPVLCDLDDMTFHPSRGFPVYEIPEVPLNHRK